MNKIKKLSKRIVALVLTFTLLFGGMISVSAAEYTSGNYSYTVTDGKAKITAYPETAKGAVEIPSKLGGYPVNEIGTYAFYACTLITEVTIPSGVTKIGDYAFAYCTTLAAVKIPSTVTSIGDNAFKNSDDVVIECKKGSYAERYAKENGIKCECSAGVALDNAGVYYDGFEYSDDFFKKSSYEYNHDMAIASLCLEIASWVTDGEPYEEPQNAKDILSYYGFETQKAYGYTTQPQMDSIACIIGCKDINVNGTDETVIAVAIRGGGYEAEWSGNFTVGNGTNHQGFETAAGKVLSNISSFVSLYSAQIQDNVKFWITGYSRAAATANLVSATLDNGGFDGSIHYINIEDLNFESSDVYAYTFETPLNTTDSSAKNSKYDNIFNIVNRIDLVTKVAPESWGYQRYGVDCYLPSLETHDAYLKKNTGYLAKMQKAYSKITDGKEYKENFSFKQIDISYEYDFDILDIINPAFFYVDDINVSIVDNPSIGMGRYLDGLFEVVADEIIGNRSTYVRNYQDAFRKLAPLLFGVETDGIEFDDPNFWKEFYAVLESSVFSSGGIPTLNTIKSLLATTIISFFPETRLTYSEVYNTLGLLDDILAGLLLHPNYVLTTFNNYAELMPKHHPEVCLAWMISLSGNMSEETETEYPWLGIFGKPTTYRYMSFNCPVDINVYDQDGQLRASIINDVVQPVEGQYLSTYIDENGSKCVCLPNDGEYTIEVQGTDSGTMSCSLFEYDFVDGEEKVSQNYYELPVNSETELLVNVENLENNEDVSEIDMIDSNGLHIPVSETIDCQTTEKFVATVSSTCDECNVYGGGEYIKGEFAQFRLIPCADGVFEGWYKDGTLVSKELEYRFMITDNCSLEARFSPDEKSSLVLSESSLKMNYKSTATISFSGEGKIIWSSSDESVAKVDSYGNVTAVGTGTAIITATVEGTDISDSCEVNVSYAWWQWIIRILLLGFIWY